MGNAWGMFYGKVGVLREGGVWGMGYVHPPGDSPISAIARQHLRIWPPLRVLVRAWVFSLSATPASTSVMALWRCSLGMFLILAYS